MSADPEGQPPLRDPDDDAPRLECGVFGVFGADDASALTDSIFQQQISAAVAQALATLKSGEG